MSQSRWVRKESMSTETILLGGGCFWCLEPIYDALDGVTDVVSGYAGGQTVNPSYEQVCSGRTGHAEVLRVTFDPEKISLREILEVFFVIHDPTTLNRQGNDVGTQYRSVVFYSNPTQKAVVLDVISSFEASKVWDDPIVTEVSEAPTFYPAEEYHQNYFERNSSQGYCRVIIAPKVMKFRQRYADRLKTARD
jgi:peptide-methionine (S)-S-oxide reductase